MAMARTLRIVLSLVMLHFLIVENHATTTTEAPAPQPPRQMELLKAAFNLKCCAKCLCVPPGTYGNKQFCPCYNNWKTKRGGPKCP
ncbi:unnamed protein product [Prunus armeniaca]|uniref:Uncharacterized protein n=1 Tax=Prunus armeniaca TaxID=36596 RepID=A0A6J5VQ80_PRUAR|nr:unnamed protein product [Prunus armeniaca]